ncbi:carboxypeptidase-like regulatory domain-containing protein [Flagellimonas aurea]|uniref:carboxypeptidase-like regulatory domain-containing protein n=1 Tax=Flagellimonas aurea TaxID=2915619 RepID=UPI0035CFDA92
MKIKTPFFFWILAFSLSCLAQERPDTKYNAGFTTTHLIDSTRIYKPNTSPSDKLHYRPIDVDIWYPSDLKGEQPLLFNSLFSLYEQRAIDYQDDTDYSGLTTELAQFYVAELGVGTDSKELLNIKTSSYANLKVASGKYPVIIYMAGFNGMGFENFKVLENLAQHGYIVLSVSSVGRYPGDMNNTKEDMLEQVYDAEFIFEQMAESEMFDIDSNNIGVLGCSWGGMGAAVLLNRNLNIKAMVSFDGTETHYFGETDNNNNANDSDGEGNDLSIKKIHDDGLLNPENQSASYLYFESGDKLNGFKPTSEYNYFKKIESDKYYMRFNNSGHSFFVCIPSILEANEGSVDVYEQLQKTTVSFFNKKLRGINGFENNWNKLNTLDYTTNQPFEITAKVEKEVSKISGMVFGKESKEPLPYVNIGVLGREIGTVTDPNGHFELPLTSEFLNDTIRISMIGYQPIEILVADIVGNGESLAFEMSEQIGQLDEVTVSAKAFKKKTLGNKTESKFISTGFGYGQLGAEMGIKINIRKNPTFVDRFNFNISYNRLSAKSIFRLNFYKVKNGKPVSNILTENILVEIEPKETGLITVDLKPYAIVLTDDVIISLEWIDSEGKNNEDEAIFFSLGLMTNGTIYKKTSQAKFKKHSSLGVGFNIDVRI